MSALVVGNFLKEAAEFFEVLPDIATKAASRAINDVAEHEGLAMLRKDMESQVNFPPGYLQDPEHLQVSQKANPNRLEAVIRGRDRATSLARFAPGQSYGNASKGGLVVRVKRGGGARVLKHAFFVKLKNGNIGLAVRLKSGEQLKNSEKAVQLDKNLYLLYGPSVDQVLRLVAEERLPQIGTMVGKEFLRQFTLLSRG